MTKIIILSYELSEKPDRQAEFKEMMVDREWNFEGDGFPLPKQTCYRIVPDSVNSEHAFELTWNDLSEVQGDLKKTPDGQDFAITRWFAALTDEEGVAGGTTLEE